MRKILSNFLKVAITVFLFWWLSRSVNLKELWAYFRSIPTSLILTVFALGIFNVSVQALRFFYSVHLLMPPFTAKQAIISHFSGFAFRLILPGSVGEVGKTFLLPGDNKLRIYTFLLDAFYSTGVMFFFFGISTFLLHPKMWYMLSFCLIFFVFFWIYRLLLRTTNFKQHVPEHVPYFRLGFVNIGLTMLTLTAYIFQYWMLMRQWGITLFDQAKACFFILGVGSIPLSFAGIGFRENAAQHVLQPFGIPAEAAVGGALFIFTVNVLVPALIGVILLNFASDIKLKDMKAMIKKKDEENVVIRKTKM